MTVIEHCPTCSAVVRVVSEDEGTSHYELLSSTDLLQARAERDALAEQLQGAVHLTEAERERVLWWLRQPVVPGPAKALDEAIICKIEGR